MTLYDLTYYWSWNDRFVGGNRFWFSNNSRTIESEQQIQLRSDCVVTEAEMVIFTNTAGNALDIFFRKNQVDTISKFSWIANQTGTQTPSLLPLFYSKGDRICFRMNGPSSWNPQLLEFRMKLKIQFEPA